MRGRRAWPIVAKALGRCNSEGSSTFGDSDRNLLITDFESGRIVGDDESRQTRMPCGPDLSYGTPPVTSSKLLVTVTVSP